jgi:hypothetical protein
MTSNENAGDGAPRSSNRSTLPEALMSNLRPLLERKRELVRAEMVTAQSRGARPTAPAGW